jgi:rod shape determining protein RodA
MGMIRTSGIFKYFDWISCIITATLSLLGVLFIFSATYSPLTPCSLFFKKQLIGLIGGALLYGLIAMSNNKTLLYWGHLAYYAVIGLLFFTLLKGSVGMGAQRWINLFFIKLQPSELAKALFPAFVAYTVGQQKEYHFSWSAMMPVLCTLIISFILILKQPDLGTALVFLFTASLLLWMAGMPRAVFVYGFIILFCAAPVVWKWGMKEYQKKRISVFLGEGQSHKERYQIEQAHIAIGSGSLTGKGFLQGTQNKLHFLPEGRTDFIFAVLAEEWGFLGACIVLMLYLLLFVRLLSLIRHIQDPSMCILAIGIVAHIIISTIVNVAMVMGLLPVVGVPLPLMSYGLSNLWVTLASLGWVQSIIMHEFAVGRYTHTR